MLIVITWYLALQLFAFAAWPLILSVCNRLHDRGYALSKGLGLLLVTYITWILAHMGAKIPVLGFSFSTVSAAWFFVLIISLITLARNGRETWDFLRRNVRYVVTLELVLLITFSAMIGFRAMVPHISYHTANIAAGSMIDHAAEKFTDFAVLNSLLTSSAFPPHDAWVSGDTLNYYYFGHMLWATLIKFCSVRPEIGFNLGLAGAFGLCSALAFGLGYNLTRRLRWGFLSFFLIILCSNLDGFLQFFTTVKTVFIDTAGQDVWYIDKPWWRNYDFWRTSRVLAGTINEFPAFSFILGDLHAHMSALIISLCGWHLVTQVFYGVRRYRSLWRYEINAFDELFIAAIICGALSASNSWDVPLFAGALALALFCGQTGRRDPYAYESIGSRAFHRLAEAIEALMVAGIVATVGVVFLYYPFLKNFQPPVPPAKESMLMLVSPENRSNPFEFFTQWILFAAIPVLAAWVILKKRRSSSGQAASSPSLLQPETLTEPGTVAPGAATIPHSTHPASSSPPPRTFALLLLALAAAFAVVPLLNGWISVLMFVAALILGTALVIRPLPPISKWIIGLLLMFCVMTCFCEIVYLNDIFSGNIERINTVFKVYYGLWPLMAVATLLSARLLIRMASTRRRWWRALWLIAPLVILGSPYFILGPLHRINSSTRLGHFTPPADRPDAKPPSALLMPEARPDNLEEALDGLRYLAFIHPDDYAALMWVRAELLPDAILLEAAGSQYTYSGRFGTITGRPSFAGWLTHAWGWRGASFGDVENSGNERNRRTELADRIYNESDAETARQLMEQENIEYIIIGDQEREQYPAINEAKFASIATKVFEKGNTAIYKLDSSKKHQAKQGS